jgi:ATP-dependent RNA helicase DeaD
LLKQVYYNIRPEEKFSLLLFLLKRDENISLVFCATRQEVDIVTRNLAREGIKAMAIHGGLTQNKRLQVVEMLKKEHITVLVATDVAARGLDIKNVTHVFNYDVPKNSDEYTHRVGRTARAGEKGEAVTLLTQKDYNNFSSVLSDRTIKVVKADLPKFPIIKFERNGPREKFGQRPQQGGFHRGGHSGGFSGNRGSNREQGRSSEGRPNQSERTDGREERPSRPHQGRNFTNRSGGRSGGFQIRR